MRKTASQIANKVLRKLAGITDEEIARGLSGQKPKRNISDAEVAALSKMYEDAAREESKYNIPIGAGVGGALGAGLGGLAGRSWPAAGIGLGVGALGGAGLGALGRYLNMQYGATSGRELGDIARQGQVPFEFETQPDDLISHAIGTQKGLAKELSPAELSQLRSELGMSKALRGGAQSALNSAMWDSMDRGRRRKGEDDDYYSDMFSDAAIHGGMGALRGHEEGRALARQLADLHARGYGHLASRILAND